MLGRVIGSRRSAAEIVSEILALCDNGGIGKTAIMYRCNLSYEQLSRYLSILSTQGLIARDHRGRFQLTPQGNAVHGQLTEVVRILHELQGDLVEEPDNAQGRR